VGPIVMRYSQLPAKTPTPEPSKWRLPGWWPCTGRYIANPGAHTGLGWS
jgi:hypothetical protein